MTAQPVVAPARRAIPLEVAIGHAAEVLIALGTVTIDEKCRLQEQPLAILAGLWHHPDPELHQAVVSAIAAQPAWWAGQLEAALRILAEAACDATGVPRTWEQA